MRHVRGGLVGAVIAMAAVAGCGGGATSVSTVVVTAPAPTPPVTPPAPTSEVALYPPPKATVVDDIDGLTRGCDARIGSSTPAEVRKLSAPSDVVLPQVQFLRLGALESPTDSDIQPDRKIPYYIVKSVLTVLPGSRARVTLAISAANAKVGFIYRSADLDMLQGRYRLPRDASSITFPVCSYESKFTAASWAGGVVFDKPTCARIDLIGFDGTVEATRRVRLGVPTC